MGFGQYNISATSDPAGAFMKAMQMGQNISGNMLSVYNSAVQNRYKKKLIHAQTDAAEAAANARHIQNQYLPGMLAAKGKTEQLTDAAARQKLSNPLLHSSGALGQLIGALFIAQHPNQYNMPQQQQQQNQQAPLQQGSPQQPQQQPMTVPGQPQQTGLPSESATGGQQISTGNPMADMVLKNLQSQEQYKDVFGKYYAQRLKNLPYQKLPQANVSQNLAYAAGMGVPNLEASKYFMSGKTLNDLAKEKGLDLSDVKPIFATDQSLVTKVQMKNLALQAMNSIESHTTPALGKYIGVKLGSYSPKQIKDALTDKNPDDQARFLAAAAIQPELSGMRAAAVGARVGQKILHDITDASIGKLNAYRGVTDPKVFEQSQKYLTDWINESFERSQAVLAPYSKLNQPTAQLASIRASQGTSQATPSQTVLVSFPDGTTRHIPSDMVNSAISKGGKVYGR